MEIFLYCVLTLAVAGIFCVYRHYSRNRFEQIRRMRKRVTLLLWAAANRTD